MKVEINYFCNATGQRFYSLKPNQCKTCAWNCIRREWHRFGRKDETLPDYMRRELRVVTDLRENEKFKF